MLRKSNRLSFGWAGVLVAAVFAFASSCGGNGNANGSCTPNEEQACPCSSGETGYQTCDSDGVKFSACQCGEGGSGGSGGSTGGSSGSGTNPKPACGDGVEQAGECKAGGEFYCAEDCKGEGGSGGSM